ncbi:MAG: hypothetical protein IPK63_22175 [Candidatus Competibacteraceae bacterium]|nr:hypothetical protein [Candidatus Competibacteraceae bacterium]
MKSVVENQPKVLAESGHPFLKYLLDQLIAWQIKDVVLCTGYLGEQIEARFGQITIRAAVELLAGIDSSRDR